MSGSPPIVRLGGGAAVAGLVAAAGTVADNAGVPVAVIGGLAVTVRLATAHRATADVDVVADDTLDSATETGAVAADNLVAAGVATRDLSAPPTQVRLDVGGTKVEVIATYDLGPDGAVGVDPAKARLFVLGHRWALDTAAPVRITVSGSDVEATLPVAAPAALVAMKCHAIQDRSELRKRGSDAWDLFRLLAACDRDGAIAAAFAGAPDDLGELVGEALDRLFRREATRTRRWVVGYGEPGWSGAMTVEAMGDIASDLLDRLGR